MRAGDWGDQGIKASATFDAVVARAGPTQGAGVTGFLDRLTAAAGVAEAVVARGAEAERTAPTTLLDGTAAPAACGDAVAAGAGVTEWATAEPGQRPHRLLGQGIPGQRKTERQGHHQERP